VGGLNLADAGAALAFIAPDDRDTWLRMGMALKSEFGEDAWDCFDRWSQGAPSYKAKDARSVWKSIKPSVAGGVSIGTLIHEATARGWKPAEPAAAPDPEELARRTRERQEQEAIATKQTAEKQAAAAQKARHAFDAGGEDGSSPYLEKKGVAAHGVRFATTDVAGEFTLLVPMRDAGGEIHNLQRIAPNGSKLFFTGARVTGLFHLLGSLAADIAAGTPHTLLIAEGYATAGTLREATGLPVACAFTSNNLAHVARAMRGQYPQARILVCGDDDRDTEAKTKKNPGIEAARKAARAIAGAWVKPEPLPEGKSDFNDLAQAHGPQAVKALIDTALARMAAPDRGEAESDLGRGALVPKRYRLDEAGLWYSGIDKEGKDASKLWVCSPMRIIAATRDVNNSAWGSLLEWYDRDGVRKQWPMPAHMLSGDGNEYRKYLLDEGLPIGASMASRQRLTEYIQRSNPKDRVRCVDIIGWHGRQFVLPDRTIGSNGERVIFQSAAALKNPFQTRGTLVDWQNNVARWCARPADHPEGELLNTRLVFAIGVALGGPLLNICGMESGAFHLRGDQGLGKTTVLRVAASIWGAPGFMMQWRATANALEGQAALHSDTVLVLDDFGQIEAREAGDAIYLLANGSGKARAQRTGAPRPVQTWHELILSSGEVSLAIHMAEADKKTRGGQEVRFAEIPADTGSCGVFDSIDAHAKGGAGFSKMLFRNTEDFYGVAGEAWLHYLVSQFEGLRKRVRKSVDDFVRDHTPPGADAQVQRVGDRFALVAIALELATEAGITGFGTGQGTAAALVCFKAWIVARGGAGNAEHRRMIEQVRDFVLSQSARFAWWHREGDDRAPHVQNRVGLRKLDDPNKISIESKEDYLAAFGENSPPHTGDTKIEYYVYRDIFRKEVCAGLDSRVVVKLLIKHGLVYTDKEGRADIQVRLPLTGKNLTRIYRISNSLFEWESD
jgi:putative DNA primase/helicase